MPPQRILKYKYVKAKPNFKPGRLDHYVKAHPEPKTEQAFRVVDGLFFDIAKERHENFAIWDSEKVRKSRLVTIIKDGKTETIRNRSNPKNVHTHPGENRTPVLPSIKDIRTLYLTYIENIFNNAPKLQENTSWIVGQDTANHNRITGKTIVSIPKEIQQKLRSKYSIINLDGKYHVKINTGNGRFYTMPLTDFNKKFDSYFEDIDTRIHKNIIGKLKTKDLSPEDALAEYNKEYLIRIQRLFGLKLEFRSNPGYKLNENNFFFEKE